MTTIPQRINQLRNAMQTHGIDALIIPSADPHLSEYLPSHWQGREYFSGFTGSVATLIVTKEFAGCWVDSRYWSQAETELAGTGITIIKAVSGAASHYIDWLSKELKKNQVVSVDGTILGLATARHLQTSLKEKQIELNTQLDIVGLVWDQRPCLPTQAIYEHPLPFATTTRQEKLKALRQQMGDKGADWHFISTVDDIAWLLNLRGADVSYNPVFIAHALIGQDSASLFIDINKVPSEIAARLAQDNVQLKDYAQANAALANLPSHSSLLIDPRRITYGFQQAINKQVKVIEALNPTVLSKSRKNKQECHFVREAMEQDGAALCDFFSWFENNLGKERITEITIDEKISSARAKQTHFVSLSFGTIAGFNGNGAMPHYRATSNSHATIEGNGLLLIDSGGQYLNGTTDITRVVPVGDITAAHKRDFSLVLKGMIALSSVQFPHGTYSTSLDILARAPMWAEGINYGHGTGHGVGYFMNVHEGPQSISGAIPDANMVMEIGMITSNEPGIYRPNQWGIRIENLMLCVPAQSTEFGEYLKFETLTLCPIDTRCIDMSIMTPTEISWLNAYHKTVLERLSPHVSGDALDWLKERTKAI